MRRPLFLLTTTLSAVGATLLGGCLDPQAPEPAAPPADAALSTDAPLIDPPPPPEYEPEPVCDLAFFDSGVADAAFPVACSPAVPPPSCATLHPTTMPVDASCAAAEALAIDAFEIEPFPGEWVGPRAIEIEHRLPEGPADGLRWRLEGSVPPGVWIDACTGTLQGELAWAPAGPLTVVVEFDDPAGGCRAVRRTLDPQVQACAIPVDPQQYALPPATIGQPYDAPIPIWNPEGGQGIGRVRLALDARLPAGLTLDCSGARVVGVPEEAGAFAFEVTWLERGCGGVSQTDTATLEIAPADPADPAACAACGPDELCVVFSDGTCDNSPPRCVPDPANCAEEGCTDACRAQVCNVGEEVPFFACDPLVRCVGEPFFNCYGP